MSKYNKPTCMCVPSEKEHEGTHLLDMLNRRLKKSATLALVEQGCTPCTANRGGKHIVKHNQVELKKEMMNHL